jgi:hypothetical protein
MFENDKSGPVAEAIDLVLTEAREMRSTGLHFRIFHQFRAPGTECLPGEEVLAICLDYRGREYQLPLSPSLLLICDYLLRHSRFAQTATQISIGIHESGFYAEHGRNVGRQRTRRIPRSAIREYIRRLHRALAIALKKAGLSIDPESILVVEQSVSNHARYTDGGLLWK